MTTTHHDHGKRSRTSVAAIWLSLLTLAAWGCGRVPGDAAGDVVCEDAATDSISIQAPPPPSRSDSIGRTSEEMLRYMEASADSDAYTKSILPDMARDVPQYARRILESDADGFLIVDKNTMRIYRYDRQGVLQESVGMACSAKYGAKHKRRDNRTPEGFFTIEGKYDSTDWLYTDDDGNTSQVKGQFGPRFLRLATDVSSQIGIHGTCAPWSIGGRRSHGCIRITNENIMRFYDIVQKGWPVIVSPGRKDQMVNAEEGFYVPTVAVLPGKPRLKLLKDIPLREEPVAATDTLSQPEGETTAAAIPAEKPREPAPPLLPDTTRSDIR